MQIEDIDVAGAELLEGLFNGDVESFRAVPYVMRLLGDTSRGTLVWGRVLELHQLLCDSVKMSLVPWWQ